jgi:hypothetical protein
MNNWPKISSQSDFNLKIFDFDIEVIIFYFKLNLKNGKYF